MSRDSRLPTRRRRHFILFVCCWLVVARHRCCLRPLCFYYCLLSAVKYAIKLASATVRQSTPGNEQMRPERVSIWPPPRFADSSASSNDFSTDCTLSPVPVSAPAPAPGQFSHLANSLLCCNSNLIYCYNSSISIFHRPHNSFAYLCTERIVWVIKDISIFNF